MLPPSRRAATDDVGSELLSHSLASRRGDGHSHAHVGVTVGGVSSRPRVISSRHDRIVTASVGGGGAVDTTGIGSGAGVDGGAEAEAPMGQAVRRVLASLQLQQYADVLFAEGFDTIPRLCLLAEEDLDVLQVRAGVPCLASLPNMPRPVPRTSYPCTHARTHAHTHTHGFSPPHTRVVDVCVVLLLSFFRLLTQPPLKRAHRKHLLMAIDVLRQSMVQQ